MQEVKEHIEVEAKELNQEPCQPLVEQREPDKPLKAQGTLACSHPIMLGDALGAGVAGESLGYAAILEVDDQFIQSIKDGYPDDLMFKLVIDHPKQHVKSFVICDRIIQMINSKGSQVVCIP